MTVRQPRMIRKGFPGFLSFSVRAGDALQGLSLRAGGGRFSALLVFALMFCFVRYL
ncbi:hypothetical protein Thivi_3215 [Thiocystis violascens DSM 198]|uniref:Uncharacterized protein n=1 Tax=Thiocystis violascens (strain ATCC 17096 / DSM 198 / 6111) TaxID=765911 RepID=I3YDM4_THIV6|nr:hypothetical protein Thivi_3215 [Thiocystis violascens DSM 198]